MRHIRFSSDSICLYRGPELLFWQGGHNVWSHGEYNGVCLRAPYSAAAQEWSTPRLRNILWPSCHPDCSVCCRQRASRAHTHTHTSISLLFLPVIYTHSLEINTEWSHAASLKVSKTAQKLKCLQIKPSHTHTHTRSLLNGNRGVTSRFNPYLWETTTLSLLWINILW